MKVYYSLIRDNEFDWPVGSSATTIGSEAVGVDYFDERRFTQAAVGRARTGLAVTRLTYRRDYTHGLAKAFSRIETTGRNRNGAPPIRLAWGMSDWASRSGQGAYLDWVVGNALLPATSNPQEDSVARVDRATVPELGELADIGADIQRQLDQALAGLNPLGIPPSVVPFDIDVNAQATQQRTAFDIFYNRVLASFKTAQSTLLEAAGYTRQVQKNRDHANHLRRDYQDREFALNSRLIELFGTPFPSNIGAGKEKVYPPGYNGPDIFLFGQARCSDLFNRAKAPTLAWSVTLPRVSDKGVRADDGSVLTFQLTNEHFVCIDDGSDERRVSPGAIQTRQRELVLAANALEQGVSEYRKHIRSIQREQELVEFSARAFKDEIDLRHLTKVRVGELNGLYRAASTVGKLASRAASSARETAAAAKEAIPVVVGFSNDVTSVGRAAVLAAATVVAGASDAIADLSAFAALGFQQSKEIVQMGSETDIAEIRGRVVALERLSRLRGLVHQEPYFRNALYTRYEAVRQAADNYRSTLAEAQRVLGERHRLRSLTAGDVRQLRYRDMTYRLLRSAASARYGTQFEKVLREAFLLARIFDYSTNFAEGDPRARAVRFYERLLRTRTLGKLRRDSEFQARDDDSVASVLAEMKNEYENFRQYLGIPISEPETLLLGSGLFRIPGGVKNHSEEYKLGNGGNLEKKVALLSGSFT